ncbi:MAG: DegT/DnrJ/EryC1/StrS family aminotransferase [bacterium]|nr:DegT/DnrJ/EryC1/StrS family aminotransferase [bacterium]
MAVKPVPLLDLKAQFAPLREEIRDAIDRIVDSQRFILGQVVEDLEADVCRYTGSPHAVGCASGTDALILALAGLGVGDGDEVVTSPFSFFSTASCAYKVGARPVFADIDPQTFNLDPESVATKIGPKTRALIPVHLFGQCADMDAVAGLARDRSLPVVEDAAQALGAAWSSAESGHAGTIGDLGCYSFFPTKNLGAFGDAGMIVARDAEVAERLMQLRVHGGRQMYEHKWVGWNSRLDALQAAVLRVKLPRLDSWSAGRKANAERYDLWFAESGLIESGDVKTPWRDERSSHIYNQYTLRVTRRDALREHLAKREIGHSVYYPVPLHLQPCFGELGYSAGDFPNAEAAAQEVVSLPIYPELDESMQRRVVDALVEFYRPLAGR